MLPERAISTDIECASALNLPNPQVTEITMNPPILRLPAEVRTRIFTYLLAANNVKYDLGEGYTGYQFCTNLFLVSRQICEEAREVFRRKNIFIRISTLWLEAENHIAKEGQVPIIARTQHATSWPCVHMTADVEVPEMHAHYKSLIVICIEDLYAFCKIWFYSDLSHAGLNSYLHLRLTVEQLPSPGPSGENRVLARSTQEKMLQPFTMIKNLHQLEVHGVYETVKEEFLAKNKESYDTPEHCLDSCQKLKEQGNQMMKDKQYRQALELYERSFLAMHIVVHGRRRRIWGDNYFNKFLDGGTFDKQEGNMVRMLLRVQLVANTIQAYLDLDEPEEAHFWGMRSITLVREQLGELADHPQQGFPAASSWGKVYYRTGKASQALGYQDEARDLFRIAADWLPHDSAVLKARNETKLRLG